MDTEIPNLKKSGVLTDVRATLKSISDDRDLNREKMNYFKINNLSPKFNSQTRDGSVLIIFIGQ